tara:strand:+ start:303 stop:1082 length:780 start_codon:yes stop_codon:yes gene_type:complete
MDYICEYCSKRYVRKRFYQHHILICQLSKKDSKEYTKNLETTTMQKIPSQRQLYEIIIDLNNKYERLQQDYQQLKVYVNNKRRQIDIIEWLNENCQLEMSFQDIFLNIKLEKTDLLKVFELDYIKGICDIIRCFMESVKDRFQSREVPLRAFVQKDSILYIYDECINSQSDYKWQTMSNDILSRFIRIIDYQLMQLFREWHRETERGMNEDRFGELYIKNLKTITGGNYQDFERITKIRNNIYRNIRQNLKSIMVYEFC